MLRWMSEIGSGRIRDARAALMWLARTDARPCDPAATGRWMRDLSVLGHAEIDWEDNRWAVSPPVFARLPSADGTAVLTGSRWAGVIDVLAETDIDLQIHQPQPAPNDLALPGCVYAYYDSVDGLIRAAESAGVGYVGCAAERLARALPPLAPGTAAGPPASTNRTTEVFAPDGRVRFLPAENTTSDGLYRAQVSGRRRYLLRALGHWSWCDLSTGVFLELQRQGQSVLRWRSSDREADKGTVFVDWGAPLPPLHARTLVLCSGLPPLFHSAARTAEYANVPAPVARAVAASLGQSLEVLQ